METLVAEDRVGIDITKRGIEVENINSTPSTVFRFMRKTTGDGEENSRKKILFGTVREVRTGEDIWNDFGQWDGHRDVVGHKNGKLILGRPVQIPRSGLWYTIDLDKKGEFVIVEANDKRLVF